MDGLALLCTLHADGPATLKRLRSAGCANLTALLERPLTELAQVLDVAPAAARRLLREARLLAERVGPELEAEEGPAPVAATSVPEPLALELPPLTSASTLDQGDRALLERIVGVGPAARPGAARASELALPRLAPAPTALERAGLDLSAEGPWPTLAPESVCSTVEQTEPSPVEAAPCDAGPDLAPLLALEGVDEALARELVRIGIPTLEDLARADALMLGRALQVTFAQAKRLCFLARRAAGSGARPVAAQATRPVLPTPRPVPAPLVPLPRVASAPSSAAPPVPAEVTPRPAWRIEPQTQPLATDLEHLAAPIASARARFWEPRSGGNVDGPEGLHEPQGVLVDPSEVDRPRRFSDVRRSAAQHAAGHTAPRQTAPAPAASRSALPYDLPSTGGTTLGWNFELPRPGPSPAPELAPARRTWRPLEADEPKALDRSAEDRRTDDRRADDHRADEMSAGPFA